LDAQTYYGADADQEGIHRESLRSETASVEGHSQPASKTADNASIYHSFDLLLTPKIERLKKGLNSAIAEQIQSRCFQDSKDRIRPDFKNDGHSWAVDLAIDTIENVPEVGIEEGYMVFSNEEILTCF
jgi:hypothetical protein